MTHLKLIKILITLRPGEQFSLHGDTLDDLDWLDTTPKPTQVEIDAAETTMDALAYRDLRKAEYPPIGDQLDAIWKGGQAATAMLAQVNAVKDKYPKPE